MKKIIKLLIVDNNVILRGGMKSILANYPDIDIVSESDYEQAVDNARLYQPGVLLINMAYCDPLFYPSIIPNVLQVSPQTRTLIIANSAEDSHVLQAFKQGALGCLLRESPIQELYTALRTLADEGSYLSPAIGKKIIDDYTQHNRIKTQSSPTLSAKQLEVLRLISQGYTNQEIAHLMVLSKRTVEMHAYKIFKRLKVSNRTQAIQVALRWQLIDSVDWPASIRETVD